MVALDGVIPYPPEFVARYRSAGYWEDRSMAEVFSGICARFARRTALVAGGERVSYSEMNQRARRLALHLIHLGIQPLDRLIMQFPNVPEFAYLYLALQYIGAIPIMALPRHGYAEISQFTRLSEAAGYAFGDGLENIAVRLQHEYPHLRLLLSREQTTHPSIISVGDVLASESNLSRECLTSISIDPLAPAVFQLSGGTTGIPKLIPRTHNDYLYNIKTSAALADIQREDSLLVVLPVAHNFPLACPGILGFWMHGACCVFSVSNRAEDVFSLIERERITHLELVPALLIRYLNDPLLRDYDLSSLRVITSGGQKLQPEVKRRVESLLPSCTLQEVFGMAEGLLCYVRLNDSVELRMETTGRPISPDDEILLVDDANNEVAPGEVGELLVRGPYTVRGYFRAAEQNALSFTSDGFYRTGDLLRRHPSGNYIVEGRKKDLINRGGEKISAEEIENLILSHPAVVNAACVPMPDPTLGERVCAFVILQPRQSLSLEELVDFLKAKEIAKYKLPERLEIVREFPLSKFGKVSKSALVQIITEKMML